MKISAVPPVVNAMTVATQQSTNRIESVPTPAPELPISDNSETKVAEATQPLSPQFAELAKRRRALQLKERALAEKERALSSQNSGSNGIDIARLKSQPLSVLQEAGVTYDQLTEAILANQSNSEINALKAEILALKEGVDKKFIEKDTQARTQVLTEMRREAERLSAQGDEYELVRETRSIPDVIKLIERTYDETGEVLDVGEALKLIEDELFNDLNKLANVNKIKSQFVQQNAPAQTTEPQPQQQTGMRTLKNRDTASPSLSRRARALAAWNNLNK